MVNENERPGNSARKKEKIRRVTTACDYCRNKKVRCDGANTPDDRCSICVASNMECTYLRVAKKRGPPKEYATVLEIRLSKVENLLRTHCPDVDILEELNKPDSNPLRQEQTGGELSIMPDLAELKAITPDLQQIDDDANSSDYESAMVDVPDDMQNHKSKNKRPAFLGKSSSVGLFRQVMDMKNECSGLVDNSESFHFKAFSTRRPEFWRRNLCFGLQTQDPEPNYRYPKPELLSRLVDAYFTEINIYTPIFHRPTFEQAISDGLHLRDEGFGAVLLMVCAVASGRSRDPALRMDDSKPSLWFYQVRMNRRSFLGPVRLYDVQLLFLSALYLTTTHPPEGAWIVVGVGVRLCQVVGAHRQKTYGIKPTVEGEQWKRIFWAFLVLERWMSCGFGRQCTLREEDFDLDYPIECDDEYWLHPDPEKAFKQPAGKPCTISYFVSVLKQVRILGSALRTLYSSNKGKVLFNLLGPEKEKHIVTELDSTLNKWVDSVPIHLKWDPDREDSAFARQSAHLWASYYHLQILTHRPFIAPARKSSKSGFPSLAICTNAARLCSKVIETLCCRYGGMTLQLILPTFTSGIVLLVNMWGAMGTRQATDHEKDMTALITCMQAMKDLEKTFSTPCHPSNILTSLATVGKFCDHSPLLPGPIMGSSTIRTPQQEDSLFVDEQNNSCVDGDIVMRSVFYLHPREYKSPGGCKLPPKTSHDQTGLYKTQDFRLLPGGCSKNLQSECPPTPFSHPDTSLLMQTPPAPPHPQSQHLVDSLEPAIYEEMMFNMDDIFAIPRQTTNFSDEENGSASIGSISASQFYDSLDMGVGYDQPYMSAADTDAFTLMSAAPAPMVWEDWDAYIQDLVKDTGVGGEMHAG